jgi:DNA repair photolyase
MQIIVDPLRFFTSYLGVNPSYGCNNGCGYCMLEKDIPNPSKVRRITTPKTTLELLINDGKVTKTSPLAFYNLSDPFHKENVSDLLQILEGLEKAGQENIIALITKLNPEKTAPEHDALKRISELESLRPVIVVSYANVSEKIEPPSKNERIKLMANAKMLGIPVVHYARPLFHGWTSEEKVIEMAKETSGIVDSVVIGGIKLEKGIRARLEKRGVEMPPYKDDDGRKIDRKFMEFVVHTYNKMNPELGVFYNTSCGISNALKISHYMGYQWNFSLNNKSGYCKKPCNAEQRERCGEAEPPIKSYRENQNETPEYREMRRAEERKVQVWLKTFGINRAMYVIKHGYINLFADVTSKERQRMTQHLGMFVRTKYQIRTMKNIEQVF